MADCSPSAIRGGPPTSHRVKWLLKMRREGRKPGIVLIEEFEDGDWQEREKFWIAQFRGFAKLTNGTEGGEGLVGAPPELRSRIGRLGAETKKRNGTPHPCLGRVLTDEHRGRIGEGVRNSEKHRAGIKNRDPEVPRKNLRKAHAASKGAPKTAAHKAKLRESNLKRLEAGAIPTATGTRWCNNGATNLQLRPGAQLPEGFQYGRIMPVAARVASSKKNRGVKRSAEFSENLRKKATGRFRISNGTRFSWGYPGSPVPEGWFQVKKGTPL